MKIVNTITKILIALAAVAGAVYVIATYGEKIVAWAKNLLNCCGGCCCDCDCDCECDGECDCECECAGECKCCCEEEAAPAEEAPAEEAPVEEAAPAEEAPVVEEGAVVADDADFEG